VSTKKISRAQWAQIESRVKQVGFVFDPKWKCLIDGLPYKRCDEHIEEDQDEIIAQVKERVGV
jgi:hypothetical protein